MSVVVPCFNEQDVVRECHRRLTGVMRSLQTWFELIYVDDGSRDSTLARLQEIHATDPNVTVIELARNFGHQTAVTAGLEAAHGEVVAIMDADLQDPPEVLLEMLRIWEQGYEVVYGVRESRQGESGIKVWSAKGFYRLMNAMSDVEIPLDTGDFRLLDRKAVEAMKSMPERHRLLRGMCSWIGFRQYGLKYRRGARFAGETKYSVSKMLKLAGDSIVSFSTVPLRVVTVLGFLSALLASAGLLYAVLARLFVYASLPGWTLLLLAMLLMSGLQMISLGALDAKTAEVEDPMDAVITATGQDTALLEGELAYDTLTMVQDALKRIKDGTFGICIYCGETIYTARLNAVPWTPYCLADQEKHDKLAAENRSQTLGDIA